MELWLDTINIDLIKEAEEAGILTGVTTNPTILSQSDISPERKIEQLLSCQSGWVCAQVLARDAESMIQEAKSLAQISKRIIIKIPVTPAGLKAISTLEKNGIPTLATAIFEERQLLLAAIAGAQYAAPYMNRIEEATKQSVEILSGMMKIIFNQSFPLKIMAADIKSVEAIPVYARLGVPAMTLPAAIYEAFIKINPRTESSLISFENNWLAGAHTAESEIFYGFTRI